MWQELEPEGINSYSQRHCLRHWGKKSILGSSLTFQSFHQAKQDVRWHGSLALRACECQYPSGSQYSRTKEVQSTSEDTYVNPTTQQHHASACVRSTVYRRKRDKRDKNWKQAKYQSAGECLNKLWFNVTIWKWMNYSSSHWHGWISTT